MNKISGSVQESLLTMVCFDDTPQGGRLVRALVPERFWDPYNKEIFHEAVEYLDKYNKCPGEHTLDIIDALAVRAPDKKVQYGAILEAILGLRDRVNREYILGQAKNFCRRQNAKAILQRATPLLSKDDDGAIDEIEALFAGATKQAADLSDPGILLNDPAQALSFLNKDQSDLIPFGIPEFDKIGVCPARKKYMLIVSETNKGKSHCAVHLGKTALRFGHSVLHVSLEMDREEVAQRYVQSLYSVGLREARLETTRFGKDSLGRVSGLNFDKVNRPTLKDEGIYGHLVKQMKPLARKPPLYIRDFPSGSLTIPKFKGYLDQMEAVHNFSPSLILFDYPDLCDVKEDNKRNALEKITVDLRGIAAARNLAMVGFSQVNEKKEGNVIKTGRTSEGRSKEHTADIVVSLNQTEAEYQLGLMRLFCSKNRGEKKNVRVLISQALGHGQFVVDSSLMAESSYWSLVKQEAENEESENPKEKG